MWKNIYETCPCLPPNGQQNISLRSMINQDLWIKHYMARGKTRTISGYMVTKIVDSTNIKKNGNNIHTNSQAFLHVIPCITNRLNPIHDIVWSISTVRIK